MRVFSADYLNELTAKAQGKPLSLGKDLDAAIRQVLNC